MNRREWLLATSSVLTLAASSASGDELVTDVLVVGGGTGGFAATLAACRCGMRVILTEETDWLGGQLTSQAVPPDEHPWIEQFGATRSYRSYRNAVREAYRRLYPLTEEARAKLDLNPGNGSVSHLTHEFPVSAAVLDGMLAPYTSSGHLTVLRAHTPVGATTTGDRISSIKVRDLRNGLERVIIAAICIDATELGDLLPMVNCESVTGVESQHETGEMHAASEADPKGSQAFSYCFAMDHLAGEDHTIDKPRDYAFWREYVPKLQPAWPGKLLNWRVSEPKTLRPRDIYFEPNPVGPPKGTGLNLWLYRRIADRANFQAGGYRSDITLVNWPQNDFWLGDLVTAGAAERRHLQDRAKQLSLSVLYWMQTNGFPGLRLRKDLTATEDGLAKSAYIRESRRIVAEFTVKEEHVGTDMRAQLLRKPPSEVSAAEFPDSVGVGCYRIDLHPSASGRNYIDVSSLPFQIPFGALIPQRIDNLLAGCKNIGVTHITNGCYRLHPVEWNIGEAAGMAAAESIRSKSPPRAIRNNPDHLRDFQANLVEQGFELSWPKIHPV